MRKEPLPDKDFRMKACMVLYIHFWNSDKPRTFWSRDADKQKGNHGYWYQHLYNLATVKWAGTWKSFAIFRAEGGERVGDAIIRQES